MIITIIVRTLQLLETISLSVMKDARDMADQFGLVEEAGDGREGRAHTHDEENETENRFVRRDCASTL